ncbi:E3 ubiquitin-protein ligase Rnf220-like isoform X4 [Mytilus edulis]|uniref:E3 ubiquitin-protein ligase Rnf220-like isoform X4 n=2 Tax=Mytilus edulis TaxID=6550 RepID=UPI0039EFC12B
MSSVYENDCYASKTIAQQLKEVHPLIFCNETAVAAAQAGGAGMENSTFVPNPLTSPALMVLASTAENHEGGRAPYPNQNGGDKEISSPYTTPFTMYRPGEPYPAPLYAPVPPFVRANMERGMQFMNQGTSSAFRPVSTSDTDSYHSAFSPAKKPKHDDNGFSPKTHESECSEMAMDYSTGHKSIKDERPSSISSAGISENYSDNERGTPDSEGRSLRKQRKKCVLDGQSPCCPVCGITLRAGEIEHHFTLEMEKLDRLVRCGRKSRDTTPQGRKNLSSPPVRRGKESPATEVVSQSRFETYLRIKCNRQARLTSRTKNKKRRPTEESCCPICNEKLSGTSEELNGHVELCLKKRGELEDENIDVEGDDEQYEEYTWAGQTRIRATTMLEGGFARSGFQTMCKRTSDEEVDLNVDGDDSEMYGRPQYNEADIIPCSSEEPNEEREREALRGAVLGTSSSSSIQPKASTSEEGMDVNEADKSPSHDTQLESNSSNVIEALKTKLKDRDADQKTKCLICMEAYNKPVTSIQCWHVHCEDCWLKTLGAKKLCPQCNMITSPGDLRRIYL